MRHLYLTAVFGVILGAGVAWAAPPAATKYSSDTTKATSSVATWGALNTHDPELFRDTDGSYYVFSTDASIGGAWRGGIQIRKSSDLIHWTALPTPAITQWDPAMLAWVGLTTSNASTWAPTVTKLNGKYYLYHGIITSNDATGNEARAWIGLAIADKVTGPYKPAGTVVRYAWDAGSDRLLKGCLNVADGSWNNGIGAIDPSLVTDAHGDLWLVYGSWKGGLSILQLDPKTGLPKVGAPADTIPGGLGTKIAGGLGAAYEGGTVVNFPQSDYYYLFMSCGQVTSDYSVRIGRRPKADGIAGPYFDSNGYDLTSVDSGNGSDANFHLHGNKILGSRVFKGEYGWRAPGGPSVLVDTDGKLFLAVHSRTNFSPTYYFYLQIYQLYFTADGWPVVNPNEYDGETLGNVAPADVAGTWDVLLSERSAEYTSFTDADGQEVPWANPTDAKETVSKPLVLNADGTLEGAYKGRWSISDSNVSFVLQDSGGKELGTYRGIVTHATDWAKKGSSAKRAVLSFSAFSPATGEYLTGNHKN